MHNGLRGCIMKGFLVRETRLDSRVALQEVSSGRSGRTSQYQFSTLEKTKRGHHPTLSSLLRRKFPQIAPDNICRMLSFGRCRYRVAPIASIS